MRDATVVTVLFVLWGSFSGELGFLPGYLRCTLDRLMVGVLGTIPLVLLALGLTRLSPASPIPPDAKR